METEFPIQEYRGPKLGCSPEEFAAYLEQEYGDQSPMAGAIFLAIHRGEEVPYFMAQNRIPKGIRKPHLKVAEIINKNPGITCQEVASLLSVHASTVNEFLVKLMRIRWVSRARDKKNLPYQYFPEQCKP